MAKQPYVFIEEESLANLSQFCREVARLRGEDIEDFNNLANVFMRGRKVGKIPSSSADVDATQDRVGDFNYATDSGVEYLYICVQVGSSAAWRRTVLGSF